MSETQFVLSKVRGLVIHNDGQFAEVELGGIEGSEEDIFLATIQLHVEHTQMTEEEFLNRFPVGTLMTIRTVRTVSLDPINRLE